MHRRMIWTWLAVMGGLLALAGGMALAQGSAAIGWQVIAGGGGRVSGTGVVLYDTLGQPVVGSASGGTATLNTGYWYGTGPATAVTLHSFAAAAREDAIVITWETALEVDVLGFHVYRADAPEAEPACLTPALIPATGGPAYAYVDEEPCQGSEPSQGCIRTYWLEVVDLSGKATRYGPATATIPPHAPYRLYLPVINKSHVRRLPGE